jgi:hypothetical protein
MGAGRMFSLQEVDEVSFPLIEEEPGMLAVYQSPDHVGFAIRRVFCVRADGGAVRGQHAHKQCSQLLVALSGQVRVSCTDGAESKTFVLKGMGKGVLIPPTIWAEQIYEEDKSVLMVICDRPYEVADYIRDFGEFLAFRRHAEPTRMGAVA